MRRFFVPHGMLGGGTARISGELFHHMATVLRLNPGEKLVLADMTGKEAKATITTLEKDGLTVTLEEMPPGPVAAAGPRITLYQGLPKGDKIDMIIQKATELGADAIIPFKAVRSIPKLDSDRRDKKLHRWERIAMEAARQSGRSSLPQMGYADNVAEVLAAREHSLKLLLWEGETKLKLKDALSSYPAPEEVGVIVGPEGGLTSEEVSSAAAAGYLPVTLGSRILRTETAGLAVLAILQYVWGDLG